MQWRGRRAGYCYSIRQEERVFSSKRTKQQDIVPGEKGNALLGGHVEDRALLQRSERGKERGIALMLD